MSDELKRLWDRATQRGWERGWIRGRLGRLESDGSYTVRVPGKPGWLFVRLGVDGRGGQRMARNDGAPEIPNLPVRMREESGEYIIYGRDPWTTVPFVGSETNTLPEHGWQHAADGNDPLFIDGRAILPLMATGTNPASMQLYVHPGFYRWDGNDVWWEGGLTEDLTAYQDSTHPTFVLIYLDRSDNTLGVIDGGLLGTGSGDIYNTGRDLTLADVVGLTIPDEAYLPIAVVQIHHEATGLYERDIKYDHRPWGGEGIGGSGGGSGAGVEVIAARYTTTTAQTIPDGDENATIVNYNVKAFDTHDAVTTGSSWKFTAPVDGYYAVHAQVVFTDAVDTEDETSVKIALYKNGSLYSVFGRGLDAAGSTSTHLGAAGPAFVDLSEGDEIDVRVTQVSGGSRDLWTEPYRNWIEIFTFTGDEGGESAPTALSDLTDVDLSGPQDGEVLTYDSGAWVNAEIEHDAVKLQGRDVAADAPDDGDVLTWDDDAGEWVPAAPQAGASALDDLADVNAPSPSDGQALVWDSGAGEWVAGDVTPGPVVAVYTTTAGQSIPHNTLTVVNYDTQVVDTHGAVTTGAAWRFVAPLAGNYHVSAALLFAATAAWAEHERAILYLHKNGLLYSVLDFAVGLDSSAAATTKHVGGGDVVPLAAGDAIQIRVNQNSGDTLNLTTVAGYSHISIFRIH